MKHHNKDTRENIIEELKTIAPRLSGMDRSNPYLMDRSYFKNLEETIYNHVSIHNPYEVSDDYFNQLTDSIMDSVKKSDGTFINKSTGKSQGKYKISASSTEQESRQEPRSNRRKIIKYITALAASLLLITLVTVNLKQAPIEDQDNLASTALYLEENIDDIAIEDIMENDRTVDELSGFFAEEIQLISPEDMEVYIEENIEDFNIEDLTELL